MPEEKAVANYIPQRALVETKGRGYLVTGSNGAQIEFVRDQDFGKFGKAKKPSLLKAGAEKIVWAYGLRSVFTTEYSIEDYLTSGGFFFYRVRCDLYWGDQIVTTGLGCANTREGSCGFASSYDTANSRLKIARKRALVDAALMVGQLSDMFCQDEDNDDFMSKAVSMAKGQTSGPEDVITAKQVQRIYALAGQAGLSEKDAKDIVIGMGYESTKKIKEKDYDKICEAVQKARQEE